MKIKSGTKFGLAGKFRIQKSRNGVTNRDIEFGNLITNNGLDLAGGSSAQSGSTIVSAWAAITAVGSSDTAPDITDTSLGSLIVSKNNSQSLTSSTYNAAAGAEPAYYEITISTSFLSGSGHQGDWRELAVGKTTSSLFCRALIKDETGTPITLTVASDEDVTIIYTLRVYLPSEPTVNIINYDGTDYTFTSYPRRPPVDITGVNPEHDLSSFRYGALFSGLVTSGAAAASAVLRSYGAGSIGTLWTDTPAGTLLATKSGANTIAAYVNGNHYIEWSFSVSNTQMNHATAIAVFFTGLAYTQLGVVATISPTITKDSSRTIQITFRISWERYEPGT